VKDREKSKTCRVSRQLSSSAIECQTLCAFVRFAENQQKIALSHEDGEGE
jgi:hypothetical protein